MPSKAYWAFALTGGTTGCLDKIPGADLADKDIALVILSTGDVYEYWLDDDSAAGESSPDIIAPDNDGGDKRWLLKSINNQDVSSDATVTFGTINALTLAAQSVGFTIAGGTTSKTLTVAETLILDGASGKTLTLEENLTLANGYDFTLQALGQANSLILNESLTIGNGNDGTITFSAASKVFTIDETKTLSDKANLASPTFSGTVTVPSTNFTVGTQVLTETNLTDLLDGGDTTLHDHDGITENTSARHVAVTLNASATTGGLSLSTQEISHRAATNAQTGYATAAHITAIEANTTDSHASGSDDQTRGDLSLDTDDSPVFVTVKLSGLTDGKIPVHTDDVTGFADGPTKTDVDDAVTKKHANTLDHSDAADHTQGTDTTLGTMTADIDMNGSYQVVGLQAPAAAGEVIRQTAKITEVKMEAADDHVAAANPHSGHALESVLGTSISTGLLLDATALKVSTTLQAFDSLLTGANKIPYATGADTGSELDLATTVADPGSDTTLVSEQGIREALDAAAVGAHAILDGSAHTDSVAQGVTRGSIIYGNATPAWDELVKGGADTFLGSDGTDVSYRTAAQVLASLSGEAGATFDWNGQTLTKVTQINVGADDDQILIFGGSAYDKGANLYFRGRDHATGAGRANIYFGGYDGVGFFAVAHRLTDASTFQVFKAEPDGDIDIIAHDAATVGLKLGGTLVTASAAELNILDGVTGVTAAELSYIGDVTGLIQNQIDAKAALAGPTFSGTVTVPSTNFTIGSTTFSETQLSEVATFFGSTDISAAEAETLTDTSDADSLHTHNLKAPVASPNFTGTPLAPDHGAAATDMLVNVCYGTGNPPADPSTTTIGSLYIKYVA